jgi:hypothetical protein
VIPERNTIEGVTGYSNDVSTPEVCRLLNVKMIIHGE